MLDYAMPEMNGGQVAAEMKRRDPHIPILLLSAYFDIPNKDLEWIDARLIKGGPPTLFLSLIDILLGTGTVTCRTS